MENDIEIFIVTVRKQKKYFNMKSNINHLAILITFSRIALCL